MSNFHDFLVWFDGWSENIETTPNERQWTRLKGKIAEVRAVEPVPSAVPHPGRHAEPVPAAPKPPANEREWMSHFIAALMEDAGMDHESAREVWADYKGDRTIDISRNPRTEAIQASGGMN